MRIFGSQFPGLIKKLSCINQKNVSRETRSIVATHLKMFHVKHLRGI